MRNLRLDSRTPSHRSDVLIIGGGIAGVCTALWLARQGVSVTLCEKGAIGFEQSGRNWGWCQSFGRDRRELELRMLSVRLWGNLNRVTGRETGFRPCGVLNLARDEESLARLETAIREISDRNRDVELVSPAECSRYTKCAARSWFGGLWARADGRAEPSLAAPAIEAAAQDEGATILTDCAVLEIETEAGRVSGVQTTRGRIGCGSIVIAAGAWRTTLCRSLGIRLPQLIVNESASRTAPLDAGPSVALRSGLYSIGKRLDGGYTIGGGGRIRAELTPDNFRFLPDFVKLLRFNAGMIHLRPTGHSGARWLDVFRSGQGFATLDPSADRATCDRSLKALIQDFPVFAHVPIEERWAGSIDVTPDAIPVISPLSIGGAFVITGFSGHGFGMAPGAGKLVAALVTGETPPADPTPYHIDRLADKSTLVVRPL